MNHVCTCKNAKRSIELFIPGLATTYAAVLAYCGTDKAWQATPAENRVRVTLGECSGFGSVVEVVNFLRTILDESLVRAVSAAWVDPMLPVPLTTEQLHAKAAPLVSMVKGDSGPLLSLLKDGRLTTHFQPIFKGGSIELWGYECLMRGTDADGQRLSPATIIQWAHQEQLVFMLDRVCRETHLLSAGRAGVRKDAMLLINFMPTAIYKPEFCLQTTMAAAKEADIDPSRIVFEVVEQYEVPDPAHLHHILSYYREHDLTHVLLHLAEQIGPCELVISTWDAATTHPTLVRTAADTGVVTRVRWVLDNGFVKRDAPAYATLVKTFGRDDRQRPPRVGVDAEARRP